MFITLISHIFHVLYLNSIEDRLQGSYTLTFRALHGTAPPYMTSQFTRVGDMSNRQRLQSASSNQLDIPSFCLPTVGSRAFPIAGAKVWNSF